MSNGILSKENEEHSLKMLAAQRILYDIAKRFTFVVVLFSVVLPLILSVVELFITNTGIQTVIYSISICSIIISFFLNKQVKKKKELAALIQQKFDVYVYNMPWNISLFGRNKTLTTKQKNIVIKLLIIRRKKKILKIGIQLLQTTKNSQMAYCHVSVQIVFGILNLENAIEHL